MRFKILLITGILLLAVIFTFGQTRRRPGPATKNCSLSIKAGVIFKGGDVKPAARTTFYLLDEDLKTILDRIYTPPESFERNLEKMDLISRIAGDPLNDEEIRKHTVAKATTDFSGNARFISLQPGSRFLFGMFRTSYTTVAWHVPIQLRSGAQSLTLDNDNAVYIKNR